MARNKYPEQTIAKILMCSNTLFNEKGYEKTTIQDIVDALGMSKGAIYHHFKSKEDILERLCGTNNGMDLWNDISNTQQSLNGLEKIRYFICTQLSDDQKKQTDVMAFNLLKNPKMFAKQFETMLTDDAKFAQLMLDEAIADGSIKIDIDSLMTSQIFLMLVNDWIHPPFMQLPNDEIAKRVKYLRKLFEDIHVPIIDDTVEHVLIGYMSKITNN